MAQPELEPQVANDPLTDRLYNYEEDGSAPSLSKKKSDRTIEPTPGAEAIAMARVMRENPGVCSLFLQLADRVILDTRDWERADYGHAVAEWLIEQELAIRLGPSVLRATAFADRVFQAML